MLNDFPQAFCARGVHAPFIYFRDANGNRVPIGKDKKEFKKEHPRILAKTLAGAIRKATVVCECDTVVTS